MRILGIDVGIASVGWAVVNVPDDPQGSGEIVAAGVRAFNSPEEKTQSGAVLKNANRRAARGQRRVIHRRSSRMQQIRTLFYEHGLVDRKTKDVFVAQAGELDPWTIRAQALERVVSPREFARALAHIAKHRGFRSNKKGDGNRSNKADENSRVLTAIEKNQEISQKYLTVGEMFALDDNFKNQKRNRESWNSKKKAFEGNYSNSIQRLDHEREVRELFNAQRRLKNGHATQDLQAAFSGDSGDGGLAFSQRPLQSSEALVGQCQFIPQLKRTSIFAPSFEKFRFLSRLHNIRVVCGTVPRELTKDEINQCYNKIGTTEKVSFSALRKWLGLSDEDRFDGVSRKIKDANTGKESNGETRDVVKASSQHGAFTGTVKIRKYIQEHSNSSSVESQVDDQMLDRCMEIIDCNEDLTEIQKGFTAAEVPAEIADALLKACEKGELDFVKGVGSISAEAARRLNVHLLQGLSYDKACEEQGWDHSAEREVDPKNITSPTTRKTVLETLKQIREVERKHGPFERIHLELARDVGKSIDERGKITIGIKKRTTAKDGLREELQQLLGKDRITGEDLMRYELWKEQQGRCLYTGKAIPLHSVIASDNSLQVDHILPWSRFGDNSYLNKTLSYTSANADKQNRTPYEWLRKGAGSRSWEEYSADVESNKQLKGLKKHNYLLMNAHEVEEKFRARNLNDTRYASRVLLNKLKTGNYSTYTDSDGKDRLRAFVRPGSITSALRRAWGLESGKKLDGERINDDRHHALDAIVVACCSESMLQRVTRYAQQQRDRGEKFELANFDSPWGEREEFRSSVEEKILEVFVSRPERGRIRGHAHKDTIKQVRCIDGKDTVLVRKPISDLQEADLDNIPIPEPYGKIVDPAYLRERMINSLQEWIENGKDMSNPPLSPAGDPIKKVRLITNDKVAVSVREGTADRASIVRTDVFSKPNKHGKDEYYLVPIYRSDYFTSDKERKHTPPNRAVTRGADESQWCRVDNGTFKFLFSLYDHSYIETTKSNGIKLEGYYRGIDRFTASIALADHCYSKITRGIGVKNLLSFRKFQVNRLGEIVEIKQEKRTWRGKVCT